MCCPSQNVLWISIIAKIAIIKVKTRKIITTTMAKKKRSAAKTKKGKKTVKTGKKKTVKKVKKTVRKIVKKSVKKAPKKIKKIVKKPAAKKSPKKIVKKPTGKKSPAQSKIKLVGAKPIGEVTHFYNNIGVAIVKFNQNVPVGVTVRFEGATTNFTVLIASMQFNHAPIQTAKKGQQVGIKVPDRTRENDLVFLV